VSPIFGGFVSTVLTLGVIPLFDYLWQHREADRQPRRAAGSMADSDAAV
jgi:hypothetical protein